MSPSVRISVKAAGSSWASAGQALFQRREDLDPLDGVDAEVGLQRHLRPQQIDRVAGLLGHDGEERGEESCGAG